MNKTIADAYKALKGDLNNSFIFREDDRFLTYSAKYSRYTCLDYFDDKEYEKYVHQYICTVEEFNNFKGDTVKDKMIPFDLEKALACDKVITRDGREVTQFLSVRKVKKDSRCLVGVVGGVMQVWFRDGNLNSCKSQCKFDLFMAPKKLSGFVNVYADGLTGHIFKTSKECKKQAEGMVVVACIDLSQFEEGHGL